MKNKNNHNDQHNQNQKNKNCGNKTCDKKDGCHDENHGYRHGGNND